MPVPPSSSIERPAFQQMLPVELPPVVKKQLAPPPEQVGAGSKGARPAFSFGLLSVLCPPELIDRVVRECGRQEQRSRLLPAQRVVYGLLMMCLSGSIGYARLMRHLAAQALSGHPSAAGRSAFGQARMRLGWEVMERLFRVLAKPLGDPTRDADTCFWRGRRVLAMDGTTIELVVNPELEKAYGGQISNDGCRRRVGPPRARVVSLIECGTRALIDVVIGRYNQGENSLARELVKSLMPGMIVLADRGFPSALLWRLFAAAGADLLWRVKGDVGWRAARDLEDGSYLILFGRGKPILMRVIEYRLAGSEDTYRLLTNLLDPITAPAAELAALYCQRWEIELTTREIKTELAGQGPFRSRTQDGVLQEFYTHCLLHTLNRQVVYTAAAATAAGDPDRISFSLAMDVIKLSLRRPIRATRRCLQELNSWVIAELTKRSDALTRRPRSCVRAVYKRVSRFANRAHLERPKSTPRPPLQITLRAA
jgi:hypothetical protein